ncbi:hypothetical protein D187_008367 [Cystobacter fuscus DSM 2262]|uniref:Uncharacterized protein n=1 Tax=Cystobacter fuscus (strain ATCC 25194 / DSM 2262 / NBRC 100088 / M29) TaxID=1242864 RepID=S9NY37_CYSF2|nr:hypothetical protein [Cystobacter fuscus]EPX55806.1 hypothetical protein D187_008367 [Cystobacter fuscus DSM 2262]
MVGAHLLAAMLGLYSSAPNVTVLQPTGDALQGYLEIAVQASDGPTGAGVRRVEYQLDSPSGAWTPLRLEKETMTYKGRHDLSAVKGGGHSLYLRAADFAGNLRVVSVSVTVSPAQTAGPSMADAKRGPLADKGSSQGWGGSGTTASGVSR